MRIFGWAANHSGCGQYRIGLPMWALARAGHDATPFSVLNVELPDDLDVLVGQLVFSPDRSQVWRDLAGRTGKRPALVFELDDDVWSLHGTNYGGATLREPEIRAAIEDNLRIADAVTVTTPQLAEVVSSFNDKVHVLPNCIDEALLRHQRPASERVTIGWAGGSSHNNDFAFVRNELRSFLRRNPDVDLHVIGSDYRKDMGRPDARHSSWSENLVEYLQKIDFDIGIAPLAYHAFNKSKSDLKVLEYAALGIPVVATDFGPYTDSVQHGVTGFLVKRPHEWATYLRALVNDEAMRREMGENARRWAATRTIQGNVWRWEDAYRSAIDTAGARSGAPRQSRPATTVAARAPLGASPRQRPKVFVIGHNKTGTTSVESALASFGLRMGDQARGELLIEDWAQGRFERLIALCCTADAFQDIPFSLWGTYKVLDDAFPGAKFILTMRSSSQEWYRSTLEWGKQLTRAEGEIPTAAEMRAFKYRTPGYFLRAHELIYGVSEQNLYDEDRYVGAYERHNRDVMAYFAQRPDSLLTLNVASDDAMAQLRGFLGIAEAEGTAQMPWLNRTEPARRSGDRQTVTAGEPLL